MNKHAMIEALDSAKIIDEEMMCQAEAAARTLLGCDDLTPGELLAVLNNLNSYCRISSRWAEYYGAGEIGGYYNGPFGIADEFTEDGKRDMERIDEMEKEADAPLILRWEALATETRRALWNRSDLSAEILIQGFLARPDFHEEAVRRLLAQWEQVRPGRDYPGILRASKDIRLLVLMANNPETSRDYLLGLLSDDRADVVKPAGGNLLARGLLDAAQLASLLFGRADGNIKAWALNKLEKSDYPPENVENLLSKETPMAMRAWVARHPKTRISTLVRLLQTEPEVASVAWARIEAAVDAPDVHTFRVLSRSGYPPAVAFAVRHWPEGSPWGPDRKCEVFPLELMGYESRCFTRIASKEDLVAALNSLEKGEERASEISADERCRMERDLVLLSHQMSSSWLGSVAARCVAEHFRTRQALALARSDRYHSLAYLYYVLLRGEGTLGSQENGDVLTTTCRSLVDQGIEAPQVLVLGFSSVYSLENVLATAFLTGIKNIKITAIDRNPYPLDLSSRHLRGHTYGITLAMARMDARALGFCDQTFDLVLTHRLLTHIKKEERRQVLREVHRVLKEGGEFISEEMVMPWGYMDHRQYVAAFRQLGFLCDVFCQEEKRRAADFMEEFANYPAFFPYSDRQELEKDASIIGSVPVFPYHFQYDDIGLQRWGIRIQK